MRFAFRKVDVKKGQRILLLGLGAGSVIQIVRNELNKNNHIDAVEIDQTVIDIAIREFNLASHKHLDIFCTDAGAYVQHCHLKYGLIIVDLFVDDHVPEKFLDKKFWIQLMGLAQNDSTIIFNIIKSTLHPREVNQVRKLLEKYQYRVNLYNDVDKTNIVIVATGDKEEYFDICSNN
jgi:spermidine synthase